LHNAEFCHCAQKQILTDKIYGTQKNQRKQFARK